MEFCALLEIAMVDGLRFCCDWTSGLAILLNNPNLLKLASWQIISSAHMFWLLSLPKKPNR